MNVANFVQIVASLSWLLFLGIIAIAVARASRRQPIRGVTTIIIVIGVIALVLSTASAGLVFISPQDRGVVITAIAPGYREQALQPGLRWVIPFVENVITYPISKQTYTMSIAPLEGQIQGDDSVTARTSDGQEIFIDASVLYAIDPTKVVQVHITWQNRYTDDLVRPAARGVIRDAVSQFRVEEVVTSKRFEMVQRIHDAMAAKLAENGLLLVDFILRNITFSPEYAASVEQKQIAEQQAQQAKFVVESKRQEAEQARQTAQGQADAVVIRAKGDAESRLIQAEAEAKALQLIANALQDNPELITYQYVTKLAPGVQVMLVPNNTPYLLPLPTLEPTGLQSTTVEPTPTAPPTTTP
jgi:regulator of protease activity HflC (stomatin/prohibitin superfamily)